MMKKSIIIIAILIMSFVVLAYSACTVHEHTTERVDAVSATCEKEGNIQYWKCTKCGKIFADANAKEEIDDKSSVSIPAKGHNTRYVEEIGATCTSYGTVGYWKCRVCGKKFADNSGNNEIPDEDMIIPAMGHKLIYHEAIKESCTADGNIEYWQCNYCGESFFDENASVKVDDPQEIIVAAHHVYSNDWERNDSGHWHDCLVCGESGNAVEHTWDGTGVCPLCGYEWTYTPGLRFKLVNGTYEVALSGYSAEVTDVVIPETYNGIPVTQIGASAFSLSNITSVRIPSSIVHMGSQAFFAASKLKKVYVDDLAAWCKIKFEGHASNPLSTAPLYVNGNAVTVLEIPDTVTEIGKFAFYWQRSIQSVVIGASMRNIDAGAFNYCDNITTVFFKGTASQWSTVNIGSYNGSFKEATVCYYSERDPFEEGTATIGNYWHYDENGEPVVWVKK